VKLPNKAFAERFVLKSEKTETKTYQLLQQACGVDELGHTKMFHWFRQFKESRNSVQKEPFRDNRQHRVTRK